MKRGGLILRALATGALTVSAVIAACDSNDSPPTTSSTLIDASTTQKSDAGGPAPLGDASDLIIDAAADARRSDAAPDATLGACNSYPALLCNFNGTCPPFSGIGGFGSGFQADGGLDGSTSFSAYASDSGGGGLFTMPFREITDPNTPPPSIEHCAVTCEATLRIAAGELHPITIVVGDDFSFNLEAVDGGFVHTTPTTAPAAHTIKPSNDWIRVKVHQIPPAAGSGTLWTSTLTITSLDGVTTSTTSLQTAKRGSSVRFGVSTTASLPSPALVFVDDVTCKLSDL